jgi:hypothetical protein
VCGLDVAALSPFLDDKVLSVDVSRMFSRSTRVQHVDNLMRMDRGYLAILVASTASVNSFSVLAATVAYSFYLKAIAPLMRRKDRLVTDRRARR